MKKKTWIVVLLICILSVSILLAGTPLYRTHALKRAVLALDDGATVTLDEIVPFEWDAVYTFAPYTSKSEMEKAIGIRSPLIRETSSEDMVQLIFTRGQSVAACITGYPGYDIEFAGHIDAHEGILFSVSHPNETVLLKPQPHTNN